MVQCDNYYDKDINKVLGAHREETIINYCSYHFIECQGTGIHTLHMLLQFILTSILWVQKGLYYVLELDLNPILSNFKTLWVFSYHITLLIAPNKSLSF